MKQIWRGYLGVLDKKYVRDADATMLPFAPISAFPVHAILVLRF